MKTSVPEIHSQFRLGHVYVTSAANVELSNEEIITAIQRHAKCDWGKVGEGDWKANDEALARGTRLMSVYETLEGKIIWVITEADRSATTVLLPSDY